MSVNADADYTMCRDCGRSLITRRVSVEHHSGSGTVLGLFDSDGLMLWVDPGEYLLIPTATEPPQQDEPAND